VERKGGRGKCAVCSDPKQAEIDQALVLRRPLRKLAEQYGIAKSSLEAHKKAHLSPALKAVQVKRRERGATTAIDRLEQLVQRLERYIAHAEGGPATKTEPARLPNLTLALTAIRELRATIELLAKVTGELDERPTTVVNIAGSREWIEIRAIVVKALVPFPEAMRAVAHHLKKVA
jgi:hypothetical protein